MCNYIGTETIKHASDLFVTTHDANLRNENHEGVCSFTDLLEHWKSEHAMKNPETCWNSTHGVIDEKNLYDELVIKLMNELGLAFDDERQMTQGSCVKTCIKLRIHKIIAHLNRMSVKSYEMNKTIGHNENRLGNN